MEFRLLGPLEVVSDGHDVTPRRAQQRRVLLLLLLRRNAIVPAGDLIDAIWADDPPETASTALQGHISALRKTLGPDRIATRAPGYALRVGSDEVDVERFESLLATARATRDPAQRLARLRDALALWRGDPLPDLRDEPFARAEVAKVDELHAVALEERLQAELDLGKHDDVMPELERLVRAQPLRERLRALLMLALHRAGREADALAAFQAGRRIATEELGLDPGTQLQALERQILARDPALEWRPPEARATEQVRKLVSVVVAELSSDGEDAERLGPALERSRRIVERFGGQAEPLFATSLVGIFGAARAHEDDTERAVRAALALRDELEHDAASARVGIDSGRALVTIGESKIDVAGEVLTQATQLQFGAPPNTVVVSDDVRIATSAAIDYERADGAWVAVAVRATAPLRHAEVEAAPFVGRVDELALLERATDRAAHTNVAQLVTIVGEPGAGKTRLLRELRARRAGIASWLDGRCLPYGEGITLWALAEVVKQRAGITESDDAEASRAKLADTLAPALADVEERAWVEAALASLVGFGPTQPGARDQLFAAARRLIEAIASEAPLVLIFEDLHWADPSLLDFIETLTELLASTPLLVLTTARPELLDARPGWSGGKRNAAVITLSPLDDAETRLVMTEVVPLASLPEDLVRRAGGNPLFAIELARAAAAGADAVVPGPVDAVIGARLDALAAELRATAIDASVLGEVFWPAGVAAIGGLDERAVGERLRRLAASGVVRRARSSAVRGQGEYAFAHALVRDVAYEHIPRRQRARKHEAAARWIETLAGGRVADRAELVAHHYGEALRLAREAGEARPDLHTHAVHFLRLAGDRAVNFDVAAAERLYRRALGLAAADDAERGAILAGLATALQEAGRLHDSVPLYEEAIEELDRRDDVETSAHARLELARALWNIGDTARHRALIDRVIAQLETRPLSADLARAWFLKGRDILMQRGDATACVPWIERAIGAADEVGALAVKVRALQFRGLSRWELGAHQGGVADLEEALRLGRAGGVGFETAMCYSNLSEVVARRDGPAHGLPICREGIAFAERRGLEYAAMWLRATQALMLYETGAWDELLADAGAILAWDRARGITQISRIVLSLEVEIFVDRGQLDEAVTVADALLPLARRAGDVQAVMEAFPAVARLALARGKPEEARALLREARDVSAANPAWRSHRIADCVRTALALGDLELAAGLLLNVDTSVPRAQAAVLSARAALAEGRGDVATAIALYTEASDRWRSFGHRVELAHALLGLGRCLMSCDRGDDARLAFDEAREAFASMKAPALVSALMRREGP